jgi:hypothetical protein
VSGRSTSPWRAAIISGAIAVLASGMSPAYAAVPVKKPAASKQWPKGALAKRLVRSAGGGPGMLSLELTIGAVLRP